MFGNRAFQNWPLTLVGAAFFAGLFAVIIGLTELLLSGRFEVTAAGAMLPLAAFVGYIGAARYGVAADEARS
jgi:uncharacterized membrane protein